MGSPSLIAVIDSFRPKIIRVDVQKKPDHLDESVLDDKEGKDEMDAGGSGGDGGKPLDKLWMVVDRWVFLNRTIDTMLNGYVLTDFSFVVQ